MIVNVNIPVDSASPVSFLNQNVLHKIKLRYPNLKIHPVEKRIKDLYCGFTNDTINMLGKNNCQNTVQWLDQRRIKKNGNRRSHNKIREMRPRLFCQPNCNYSEKDTSIKLPLDSKLLNDQIFKNKYQMPNIHELIDNVALQISEKSNGRVWFSNLDLKNA